MTEFKIGDKVLVKKGRSTSSCRLDGRVGTITQVQGGHCCLDIEGTVSSGLWNDELTKIKTNEVIKMKFKVGDRVKVIKDDDEGTEWIGKTGIITNDDAGTVYPYELDIGGNEVAFADHELSLVKNGKPEDLTRYMVYGTGCDNKSDLFQTEKKLKQELKSVIDDDDWTGRIIGYKLVPIFEAELKTVLKVFKTVKTKKVKGKKK